MGNCLALQDKVVIRIMKMDGKVLEYQAPLRVHQVLLNFAGHTISDTIPVYQNLCPNTELLSGHMYYLLPLPLPSTGVVGEMTSMISSIPTVKPDHETGVSRIKLIITKQDLMEMLSKGVISDSVDEMIYHLQNKGSKDDDDGSSKGWRPVLESIPEGE